MASARIFVKKGFAYLQNKKRLSANAERRFILRYYSRSWF
jgi:hypothetical protein